MRINIIGAGKVGRTLGKLLVDYRLARIGSVFNRQLLDAKASCEFITDGVPIAGFDEIAAADINFITVADDAIPRVMQQLLKHRVLQPNSILVHFSGVLSSEVFAAARALSIHIASVHPLKSFADPAQGVRTFSGTFCGIEGDPAAQATLEPLFNALGARLFTLRQDRKPLYHSGCVFASNYMTTLFDAAIQICRMAGVADELSNAIVLSLMQDVLDNLKKNPATPKVLTGSIARADLDAIQQHVAHLAASPQLKKLYVLLGEATIDLTAHTAVVKQKIRQLLHS